MQGSTFLKVMGILMIIFGAIALVMGIIALAGVGVILAYAGVEGTFFAADSGCTFKKPYQWGTHTPWRKIPRLNCVRKA